MAWNKRFGVPEEPQTNHTPPQPFPQEKLVNEPNPRMAGTMTPNQQPTILGRSLVLKGELTASEDLLIEGQFDGNINIQEHCLTVGPQGQVKADIHARQAVILGTVNGNVTARDKIEIRKTGHVSGDLVAGSVSIEDGAYCKGSIEILREGETHTHATKSLATSKAAAGTD